MRRLCFHCWGGCGGFGLRANVHILQALRRKQNCGSHRTRHCRNCRLVACCISTQKRSLSEGGRFPAAYKPMVAKFVNQYNIGNNRGKDCSTCTRNRFEHRFWQSCFSAPVRMSAPKSVLTAAYFAGIAGPMPGREQVYKLNDLCRAPPPPPDTFLG